MLRKCDFSIGKRAPVCILQERRGDYGMLALVEVHTYNPAHREKGSGFIDFAKRLRFTRLSHGEMDPMCAENRVGGA
jgi:hypothetical protein